MDDISSTQVISLSPCSGQIDKHIPRGHLWGVFIGPEIRWGGTASLFLPWDEAIAKFPLANISGSDAVCPSCKSDLSIPIRRNAH